MTPPRHGPSLKRFAVPPFLDRLSVLPAPIAALASLAVSAPAQAEMVSVPVEFRQVEGTRPFVTVRMNGRAFSLMVHANGDFYVMTTHARAAKIGIRHLRKTSNFGIASEGHVARLGRAETKVRSLEVGGVRLDGSPLSVFEVPVPALEGMLGTPFLRAERVFVDFDEGRFRLPREAGDAEHERARLIASGYRPHRLTFDPTLSTYIVTVEIDGHPARLQVGTVAQNILDRSYVANSGIAVGPRIDVEAGPRGALVETWIAKRVLSVSIDGDRTAQTQPWIFDLSAYNSRKSVASRVDGSLGAEFMLANRAVIDFGAGELFLKPPEQGGRP